MRLTKEQWETLVPRMTPTNRLTPGKRYVPRASSMAVATLVEPTEIKESHAIYSLERPTRWRIWGRVPPHLRT